MHNVNNNPFVLISAELSSLSQEENKQRTEELLARLQRADMAFKKVQGKYQGTTETSYLVVAMTASDRTFLEILGKEYGQECILYVDRDRLATLIYSDKVTPIGSFKLISKDKEPTGDYTYDYETNTYWSII